MRANTSRIQLEDADPPSESDRGRQDSQVYLKAPCAEPGPVATEQEDTEAPTDFVAFLGEKRGLDDDAAFALLCNLLSEYQTPVRREIVLLKRSA